MRYPPTRLLPLRRTFGGFCGALRPRCAPPAHPVRWCRPGLAIIKLEIERVCDKPGASDQSCEAYQAFIITIISNAKICTTSECQFLQFTSWGFHLLQQLIKGSL